MYNNIYTTWLPTLENRTIGGTLLSSAPLLSHYLRAGNLVIGTILFQYNFVVAPASPIIFGLSLPVKSNFSSSNDAIGVGTRFQATNVYEPVTVEADVANAELLMKTASSTGACTIRCAFSYIVR
jgi:hypothetical protein